MLKDPVCGKTMNRNKAHIVLEYEHIAYFLCCPHCQATFEQNPRQYAQPEFGQKLRKPERVSHRSHRR